MVDIVEGPNKPYSQVETLLSSKDFGSGKSSIDHPLILQLSDSHRFRALAHWAACPVAKEVWNIYQRLGSEAKDWILERYETTNAITRHLIWPQAAALNPALHRQLTQPRRRKPDEPVGKFEPDSVPNNHQKWIPPMAQLPNYSGARLLILMAGTNQVQQIASNKGIMDRLNQTLAESKTPEEYSARLTNDAYEMGVHPAAILEHTLEGAKVAEEGYASQSQAIFRYLQTVSSGVSQVLNLLSRICTPQGDPIRQFLQTHPNGLPTSVNIAETPFKITNRNLIHQGV